MKGRVRARPAHARSRAHSGQSAHGLATRRAAAAAAPDPDPHVRTGAGTDAMRGPIFSSGAARRQPPRHHPAGRSGAEVRRVRNPVRAVREREASNGRTTSLQEGRVRAPPPQGPWTSYDGARRGRARARGRSAARPWPRGRPMPGRGPSHLPERARRGGAAGGRGVLTAPSTSLTDIMTGPAAVSTWPAQAGGGGSGGRGHQNPVGGSSVSAARASGPPPGPMLGPGPRRRWCVRWNPHRSH